MLNVFLGLECDTRPGRVVRRPALGRERVWSDLVAPLRRQRHVHDRVAAQMAEFASAHAQHDRSKIALRAGVPPTDARPSESTGPGMTCRSNGLLVRYEPQHMENK